MQIKAIQTDTYLHSQDLLHFLVKNLPAASVLEGSILAITSKIVSIAENRLVPKHTQEGTPEETKKYKQEKLALVKQESSRYLGETLFGVHLTVNQGILIPSAGIDESNSEKSEYILFPENPYKSAEKIYRFLVAHFRLKNFGVILTDSHTTPLRKGVTGIGLSHFGFKATRNLVGKPDLFGRSMKMTHVNVLDALSTAAVYLMGETNDSCPLALLHDHQAEFVFDQTPESAFAEIQIPLEEDLYGKFFMDTLDR